MAKSWLSPGCYKQTQCPRRFHTEHFYSGQRQRAANSLKIWTNLWGKNPGQNFRAALWKKSVIVSPWLLYINRSSPPQNDDTASHWLSAFLFNPICISKVWSRCCRCCCSFHVFLWWLCLLEQSQGSTTRRKVGISKKRPGRAWRNMNSIFKWHWWQMPLTTVNRLMVGKFTIAYNRNTMLQELRTLSSILRHFTTALQRNYVHWPFLELSMGGIWGMISISFQELIVVCTEFIVDLRMLWTSSGRRIMVRH